MFRTMISQSKKHPSLIPLFIFIGTGAVGAGLYLARLALRNPDVSWDRKNNPEPWNKMNPTSQYKGVIGLLKKDTVGTKTWKGSRTLRIQFYAVNMDYSKLKKNGPDF